MTLIRINDFIFNADKIVCVTYRRATRALQISFSVIETIDGNDIDSAVAPLQMDFHGDEADAVWLMLCRISSDRDAGKFKFMKGNEQ